MTSDRECDIVLFGATGFVGRLTAEYLAEHAPAGCRLAVAGRTRTKLADLAAELHQAHDREVGIVVADVDDPASITALAGSTRVLVTTVGPYFQYGLPVVEACANAGTDYLDLTGEPDFVDTAFVRYQDAAVASGARIVHAAGFDSVPHDAGAFFTVNQLPDGVPVHVDGYVRAHATFSGGTFHSAINAFSRARSAAAVAKQRREKERGTRGSERSAKAVAGKPHRDPVSGRWAAPLPTIDPTVVVRSARTREEYGPRFSYSHYASLGSLPLLVGAGAGVATVFGLAQVPPARRLLLNRIKPGDGPSAERREKSWFTVTFVGEGGGKRVVTRVRGGDPGYGETAKMLGEAALSLRYDDLPATSGQLTPMAAMGQSLVDRLQNAGMVFEVLEQSG